MRYAAVVTAVPGTVRRAGRTAESDVDYGDDHVIRSVRYGDTEAFGSLMRKYEDFVFTLIRGITGCDEDARDLAQETFLRAYRGIRRFQFNSTFKTWLYRIAYNTTMSYLNRNHNRGTREPETMQSRTADPQESHSLRLTIEKLIGRLKPDLKAVIIFYYYDDLKYEQIAEIMGCPLNTVKIRLYRARHKLGRLWEKHAV
jgi:RNA polymerase sigma-70 factor (ECF subfamily)